MTSPVDVCEQAQGWLLMVILAVVAAAACGCRPQPDYGALGLVDVTGMVQIDGGPAAGCHVVFESEDGSFSHGITAADGRYRLMYTSERSGVLPGRKTVRITSCPVGDSTPAEGCRERIPAAYNAASTLVVEVPPTGGRFDFTIPAAERGLPPQPGEPDRRSGRGPERRPVRRASRSPAAGGSPARGCCRRRRFAARHRR